MRANRVNQFVRMVLRDFFRHVGKGALQKIEARRQKRDATGGTASTSKSEK
jgi:hypothetical protein